MKKILLIFGIIVLSFVSSAQITFPCEGTIDVKKALIRDKPGTYGKVLFRLRKGEIVTIIQDTVPGKFFLIKTKNDRIGWVHPVVFKEEKLYNYKFGETKSPTSKISVIERYILGFGEPDEKTSFVSGEYRSQTFIWYCAKGRYRSVSFIFENGWKFESQYTSECIIK